VELKLIAECRSFDFSKLPKKLHSFTVLNSHGDESLIKITGSHKTLRTLHLDWIESINLDNFPNVDEFLCGFVEGEITCSSERVFKKFDAYEVTPCDDLRNIIVDGEYYFDEDGNENHERTCYDTHVETYQVNEKFYKKHPCVTSLYLMYDEELEITDCKENDRIEEIGTDSENMDFMKYFKNLKTIELRGEYDHYKLRDAYTIAKKTNANVIFYGYYHGWIDYDPDFIDVPKNLSVKSLHRLRVEKMNTFLLFADRMELNNFQIRTPDKTISLPGYNYVKNKGVTYLTKKPWPGVRIVDESEFYIDDFETNCDLLEFINCKVSIKNLKMTSVFFERCKNLFLSEFHVINIEIDDCHVSKTIEISKVTKKLVITNVTSSTIIKINDGHHFDKLIIKDSKNVEIEVGKKFTAEICYIAH
jgi:hypothetical protein